MSEPTHFDRTFHIIMRRMVETGREHYKNYRDFLARHGLPPLITQHKLTIAARKVVGGGSFVLYLLVSE